MRLLLVILCSVLLSGCAGRIALQDKPAQITPGMTKQELQSLLGPPQNRQFSGSNEAWQYCATDYTGFESDSYLLVWINSGVVTGMQTYRNTLIGTCESFFRTVKWDEALDATVEIRKR